MGFIMKRPKFEFFKGFKGYSRSQTCSMTGYILNKINLSNIITNINSLNTSTKAQV